MQPDRKLDMITSRCHPGHMKKIVPLPDMDDEAAETAALAIAVDQARKDTRSAPHAVVRAWLLRLAAGEFDAEPPTPQ